MKKPAPKRSSRTRSGKSQGKLPGAPSAMLYLIDNPDDTVTHTPPVCAGCRNVAVQFFAPTDQPIVCPMGSDSGSTSWLARPVCPAGRGQSRVSACQE